MSFLRFVSSRTVSSIKAKVFLLISSKFHVSLAPIFGSTSAYGDMLAYNVFMCIIIIFCKKCPRKLEGAVSRNSAKLGNYKMPVKSTRNIKIAA